MTKLTTEERLDRLEKAIVQLAVDVAPHTMNNRAVRQPEILALIEEQEQAGESTH
jgi:hypothetical protein